MARKKKKVEEKEIIYAPIDDAPNKLTAICQRRSLRSFLAFS